MSLFFQLSHLPPELLLWIFVNHPAQTHLQEGGLLQQAEEFWEIIPDLLVNGSDQADLSHCPGSVRAITVSSLDLTRKKM